MDDLVLMLVLFGYTTNNNNQQNLHHLKTMMLHCRHCNVNMYNDVCICFCFYSWTHTNIQQHNKHRQRQKLSRLWYDERKWWKEDERKKKEEKDVMNVHCAQYRKIKGMELMRELVIFLTVLNGRASRTRFKSEQSIFAALGVLLYFIQFGLYYTHKYNKQMVESEW